LAKDYLIDLILIKMIKLILPNLLLPYLNFTHMILMFALNLFFKCTILIGMV